MDQLIRDMREVAGMILALYPIGNPAVQLAVMAKKAADELEKRRWIPAEERRPNNGEYVILWIVPDAEGMCGFAFPSTFDEKKGMPEAATHWMALPEGPKEESNGNQR